MPSVFIKTYGCQMNERDSEGVAAQLIQEGYALAPHEAAADVILLNTCSVRDTAERKAMNKMQALASEVRRHRPNVVLGFLGCMAQAHGDTLLSELPEINMILGTRKSHRVAEYLGKILADRSIRICDVNEEPQSHTVTKGHLLSRPSGGNKVSAFVNIMEGCNQRCTFCIVPKTRGVEHSRPLNDILDECRELVDKGVREIILLGQVVTSYGKGLIEKTGGVSPFVRLLEAVHSIDGLERIRFTAPHPRGYGDDLISAYANLPKLCESAHIPLQSGSNNILKAMKRGHSMAQYTRLTEKLRGVKPEIGLYTDIIVGFPGETESDFEDTLAAVKDIRFDSAFLFKYSPRTGTPAAAMQNQIPQHVKEERHARLMNAVDQIASEKYKRLTGQTVEVLVEGPSRKNPSRLEGRTRCHKWVVFEGDESMIGSLMYTTVTGIGKYTLYGETPEPCKKAEQTK
ncbi:MAG: tRNA (N6-isopentenyl adenosine(37)-C2)-methylthiotransferase MiaB [Verrucomicrobia bacterium]|nr:tRNA (N6-isopentenyl adenosine(37)-C2)-methylthiotransferase MiaB [Verrucomicrobiota bacterium]